MKIYLAGEYEKQAKVTEFYAIQFSLDIPPLMVQKDDDGFYIDGNEEHRKRLGANARPANAKKRDKAELVTA